MKIQDIVNQLTVIKAQLLRYGIQAVSSVSHPSAPGLGQVVFEGDTLHLAMWTGTAWQRADSVMQNVTSATRPSSPIAGQLIWETDTLSAHVYNGSAWKTFTLT